DAPALLDLWNQSAPFDPLTPDLLHEKVWADPHFDAELALVAEADRQLVGFGMARLWRTPDVLRGTIKLLCVAPDRRREGLGGQILRQLEAGLAARGADVIRIAEAAPNYLTPGIDVRYTPGWLFVQKHDYQQIGEAVNMDVDLSQSFDTTEAERQLEANGVSVRRAGESDQETVRAFLQEHWPAWIPEIDGTFAQTPVSLHLAFRAGEMLGFSAYDANNVGTGWFGPMGTAEAARGLGIGGVLCLRCLADMKAQGHTRSTIPWVAPVGFYAHYADAHVSRVFHRFEKALDE
ncbi:MAG: GNAT family N-acetyltransferase, partial [Bacteroidota bacterium]